MWSILVTPTYAYESQSACGTFRFSLTVLLYFCVAILQLFAVGPYWTLLDPIADSMRGLWSRSGRDWRVLGKATVSRCVK